jgi:anaerobic selenocysteine-containing dehydrogenase
VDAVLRLLARFGWRYRPTALAELLLRTGAHGDRYLPWRRRRDFRWLAAEHPHGLDLGPLEPGVARRIFHRDRRVRLDAPPLLAALDALVAELPQALPADGLLLIGRREVRTNNSWMHNLPSLVSGRERCLLYVHPKDAERSRVRDAEEALLESRVHSGPVRVRVTEEVQPGIVSLPHGWGHRESARWQHVAGSHPGVSINDWTDEREVESVVGQSILNGVPVRLRRVDAEANAAPA